MAAVALTIRHRRISAPLKWLGVEVLRFVPIALLSTMITFGITALAPDDTAAQLAGDTGTPAEIASLNHSLGLDRPFPERYMTWLWHALHGNLGASYFTRIPVTTSIQQRLPVDLSITLFAMLFALVLGFSGGLLAASRPNGVVDRVITGLGSMALAIPEFWLAILLVIFFAVKIRLFPATGYVTTSTSVVSWGRHLILPSLTLAAPVAAVVARQLRISILTELDENYVTGVLVRGFSHRRILFKHVLRNGAAPAVATIGIYLPSLLGGAVIAETIFSLPGVGQLAIDSAQAHDIPVIQGVLLVTIAVVLISNLAVDALLGWLRPAVRRS
jgi:peptide/nickel transport system permease protein